MVKAPWCGGMHAFTPKLGPSREEGDAGAQTGNTVRASLLQRPDPELGMRVYSLAALDRRGRILAVGAPHGVDLRVESHGFVNTDEPRRHLSATIVSVARKFADVLV